MADDDVSSHYKLRSGHNKKVKMSASECSKPLQCAVIHQLKTEFVQVKTELNNLTNAVQSLLDFSRFNIPPTFDMASSSDLNDSSKKRARSELTVADKKRIIALKQQEPALSNEQIRTRAFQEGITVGRSTVGKIIQTSDHFLSLSDEIKRQRGAKFPDLESALFTWFNDCVYNGLTVPDELLLAKAKEFGTSLKIEHFQYSRGWLEKWKKRFILKSSYPTKETQSCNNADIQPDSRQKAPFIIRSSQKTKMAVTSSNDCDAFENDQLPTDSNNSSDQNVIYPAIVKEEALDTDFMDFGISNESNPPCIDAAVASTSKIDTVEKRTATKATNRNSQSPKPKRAAKKKVRSNGEYRYYCKECNVWISVKCWGFHVASFHFNKNALECSLCGAGERWPTDRMNKHFEKSHPGEEIKLIDRRDQVEKLGETLKKYFDFC